MFGGNSIKLRKSLYDKLKVAAEIAGASSIEEFAERILEQEAEKILSKGAKGEASKEDIEDIANKLKGLGYLE